MQYMGDVVTIFTDYSLHRMRSALKKQETVMEIQPEFAEISPIIHVDLQSRAAICCPKCGFIKHTDMSKFRNIHRNLKIRVRCRCGHIFKRNLNFRKYHRKPVRLAGEYKNLSSGKKGEILIENLSLGGVGFVHFLPHDLFPDAPLELRFRLDDPKRKEVQKKATVKSVRQRAVGVEFSDFQPFDNVLSFYLRS